MTDVLQEIKDRMAAAFSAGISEHSFKALKKQLNDLIVEVETDIDYRIKEELAPNLVDFVSQMASRAIEALLDGNEEMMRRYLNCQLGGYTHRSDSRYWTKTNAWGWHPVIHGKLFEHGGLALRHKLVETHRDLITNERILDLEDQVKSLVAQVNKANSEKEQMFERLREYQR